MALLEDALDACGGMDRWRQLNRFTAHVSFDGAFLAQKSKAGLLKEIVVEGCTQTQSVRFTGFTAPNKCGVYTPDRVVIEQLDGTLLQECDDPRTSLLRHGQQAPWDDLQLAYYCGLSIWNWMTIPFLLAEPDVGIEELSPWREHGEIWRRLKAVFPSQIATYSLEQTFYFDSMGLQRRIDYHAIDGDGIQCADFCGAHQEFSGIVIPTLRRSLRLSPDGTAITKPPIMDVEIFDASFA